MENSDFKRRGRKPWKKNPTLQSGGWAQGQSPSLVKNSILQKPEILWKQVTQVAAKRPAELQMIKAPFSARREGNDDDDDDVYNDVFMPH